MTTLGVQHRSLYTIGMKPVVSSLNYPCSFPNAHTASDLGLHLANNDRRSQKVTPWREGLEVLKGQ